ncbi:MAG: hypothetical protein NZ551_03495, partial [Microscillaceae bacterium]|nr:hypothetical protein [Microscillaceae bacterium]MDW8460252.1 hypothetical protein [Cytophagales bacterium]
MAKQQKMSQKQEWLRWVWLIWLTILGSWAYAQPGKDGAYTVTGNNTVVNRYTRVVADILAGTTTVVVQDITNLSLTGAGISYIVTSDSDDPNTFNSPDVPAMVQGGGYASNALSPGDLIMLYQAQGAIIDVSNTVNYGTILDYNNAGQYEFAYVSSVSGNVITLTCPAQNTYFAAQYVQVIRVPQYTTLTINAGASISAVPWGSHTFGGANASALDRRRGGVVAIHATNIVLNGSIEVDGDGFRGGTRDNFTSGAGATVYGDYVSTNPDISAEKGESIAGYRVDYGPSTGSIIDVGVVSVTGSGVAGRYGRGAPANGGGGGNAHNAGGGGGANGNNGNAWFRGTGVMSGLRGTNTCTAPAPWTLDPDYIDNGNALTNSSGGGRGGYTYGSANRNACTEGPGLAVWGGDYRDAVGGFGGRPLAYINNERYVFFGGGGGAGDGNNNANNDGGDGGGLIYLVVTNSITGSGIISANGQNGFNTISGHNDAPGGGGGGGTIVVKTKSIANTITFRANGGQGGDQLITNNESEGPGGGGGGGYIALSSANNGTPGVPATPTRLANGGDNGVTSSAAVTEFTMNGATKGASGQPNELISRYFIPYTTCKFPDNDGDGITDNNDIDDDNDGILDTTEGLNFDFSGDSNNNGIPDFLDPALGIWIDANVDGVNDLADRDNDGVPNHLDLDSDNDGIFDVREARANSDLRNVDANDDGRVDGPSNTNGFPDAVDNLETTSLPLAVPDTDGDGWRDFLDLDSDNDGINDVIEAFPSATAPPLPITVNDPDRNGIFGSGAVPPVNDSGFATGATGQNIPDKDGDGVPNFRDLDSDNDGINDVREANRPDTNNDGLADGGDADGDGIRDSVDGNNASFGEGINGDAFIPNTDATYEDAAARLFDFLDL